MLEVGIDDAQFDSANRREQVLTGTIELLFDDRSVALLCLGAVGHSPALQQRGMSFTISPEHDSWMICLTFQ